MKKLQKMLVSIVVILLIIIVAVAVLIKLYGNQVLKVGIEKGSQAALKVDTRLERVNLSILGGTMDLSNLEIDNPAGYEHPTFLKLGHGYMALKTGSLLSDTITFDTMQFEKIEVVIEQKGTSNNLKEILNNLPKAKTEEPAKKEKPGKNLKIKQLDLNGIEVKVKLLPIPGRADTLTLKISPIHMENIGSGEKIDTSVLVSKILKAIAGGIAEQGKDILPIDMLNSIGHQFSEQGQQLIESGKDIGTGLIEDVGKSATEALKGLNPFQKKEEE